MITAAPKYNGSIVIGTIQKDIGGSFPKFVLQKGSRDAIFELHQEVDKFVQQKYGKKI
jgi:hypothetical protein